MAMRLRHDAKLYDAFTPLLNKLQKNWDFAGSSIRRDRKSEIYVFDGPSDLLCEVWLNPMRSPSSLLVRLKTKSQAKQAQLVANLERAGTHNGKRGLTLDVVRLPNSSRGNHWAVEVRAPWRPLLRRASNRTDLARTLEGFVLKLMRAADPAAA
jgi:hypothetical protein